MELLRATLIVLIVASVKIAQQPSTSFASPSSVSGRVLGAGGEPLVSMNIQLVRNVFDRSGHASLVTVVDTVTDEQGEYRIGDVPPGRYYLRVRWSPFVLVRQSSSSAALIDAQASNGREYAPIYYVASSGLPQASPIDLRHGEELTGVNVFPLLASQLPKRKVRIHLVDGSTGKPPAGDDLEVAFTMTPKNPGDLNVSQFASGGDATPDGTYEVDARDGDYWLTVRVDRPGDSSSAPSLAAAEIKVGSVLNEVFLTLGHAGRILGRVILDGRPWRGAGSGGLGIELRSSLKELVDSGRWTRPSPAIWEPDGSFSISGVGPEVYSLQFTGVPQDAYIQTAEYSGLDALRFGISFNSLSPAALEIALSTNSGEVRGSVIGEGDQGVDDVEAILIPEQPNNFPLRYKTVRTDDDGRFSIRGIAPGEYTLYSWADLSSFDFFDMEFMQRFETQGLRISVGEGTMLNENIRMMTP